MLTATLMSQIGRLKIRFGDRAFDQELISLIYREVQDMSDQELINLVDSMIGSRPASRPPLLDDFRQERLKMAKARVSIELELARKLLHSQVDDRSGLGKFLKSRFPGCKTLGEAIEVRKLQIQVRKADDPTYDPLADPDWQ